MILPILIITSQKNYWSIAEDGKKKRKERKKQKLAKKAKKQIKDFNCLTELERKGKHWLVTIGTGHYCVLKQYYYKKGKFIKYDRNTSTKIKW